MASSKPFGKANKIDGVATYPVADEGGGEGLMCLNLKTAVISAVLADVTYLHRPGDH